jgi:hypothetical protein
MTRPTRAIEPDGCLLGSYPIATAPEPNSTRLTSFRSRRLDVERDSWLVVAVVVW